MLARQSERSRLVERGSVLVDSVLPPGARPLIRRALRKGRRAGPSTLRKGRRVVSEVGARCRRDGVRSRAFEAAYLAVLDGRSLNVHVVLPADVPVGGRAVRLSLRRNEEEHLTPLTVESGPGGQGVAVSGVLPLEEPGRALRPGVWSIGLVVSGTEGPGRETGLRFGLRPPRTGSPANGPTVSSPSSRTTGCRYVPEVLGGRAVLRVHGARPRAEVTGVRLGFSAVEVEGRLIAVPGHGTDEGTDALPVRFTERRGKQREEALAQVRDGCFRYALPLDALAAAAEASEGGAREQVWDCHMRVPVAPRPVRVGKLLTDAVKPAAVHQGSDQIVRTPSGALLRIRYYYTPAGSLAFACFLQRPAAQVSIVAPGDQL